MSTTSSARVSDDLIINVRDAKTADRADVYEGTFDIQLSQVSEKVPG